jgi:hypothetical protein
MKQRTVAHDLDNWTWVSDIMGHLKVQVIVEYIQIWNLVDGIMLQQVTDHHVWKLSNTGIYTSKSWLTKLSSLVLFGLLPWRRIWKSWKLLQCEFLRLAILRRCWTQIGWQREDCIIRPHACFVIRLRKLSIIFWSLVSLQDKCGALFYLALVLQQPPLILAPQTSLDGGQVQSRSFLKNRKWTSIHWWRCCLGALEA